MADRIEFYSTRGEHGYMSNFALYPIVLLGKRWATSEHFFQAMKFRGTAHETAIQRAKGPSEAASMGRDRKRPLRRDWENVKDDVMRRVVLHKFLQHDVIRAKLIATGAAKLVEHTDRDRYWGDGGNGSGKNMLGLILEEVRQVLRRHQEWAGRQPDGTQSPADLYLDSLKE